MRKTLLRRFTNYFGAAMVLSAFVGAFLAYFVSSSGPDGGVVDGLGRSLAPTPGFIKLFMLGSDYWAGWGWFFADYFIFGGLFIGGVFVASVFDED